MKVLVIDDEQGIRDLCAKVAASFGCDSCAAASGREARKLLQQIRPDYVFLDINLPDCSGMDLLVEIRQQFPAIRVVMITGLDSVEMAVKAMKLGAYDYLRKPDIVPQIREILAAGAQVEETYTDFKLNIFLGIAGVSKAMQRVFWLIERAARSDSAVIIQGESGTGKELVARAIHLSSSRMDEPFVPVDCGAITPTIIESELFGHLAGAYTDAKAPNIGLLRSAGDGTAFLDEIAELPISLQVKLLRALQEKEVRPVGSTRAEPLNARIIAATNRDLQQAVELGAFRRDLFYRLHVLPIFVPPLRERREDIPLIVGQFIQKFGPETGRTMSVTPEAMEQLMRRDWPGNVRELENLMRRAFALLDRDTIRLADMPLLFEDRQLPPAPPPRPAPILLANAPSEKLDPATPLGLLREREAQTIRQALKDARGNKRQAARALGIGIATLYRKIKKYGLGSA